MYLAYELAFNTCKFNDIFFHFHVAIYFFL